MSKQTEFEYIEAKEFLHLPVIEISEVKAFTRFANANDIRFIFKIKSGNTFEFFFPHSGIVYKLAGNGFLTLNDMQQAQNRNFPGATQYYEAQKAGFETYQEYVDLAETGIENKEDYEAASKAGFVKGFEKFKTKYEEYRKNENTSLIAASINNPVRLHQYALQKDIKTYEEFEKIYNAGFPDTLSYQDAASKGFAGGNAYFDALKRGFSEQKEYEEAKQRHIETKKDYDEFRFLNDLNANRHYTYDQLQLLIALSNCENGKVISITEAKKMLQDAQEKLKRPAGPEGHKILPSWYVRGIDQENKLIEFLKANQELKKFGFFNSAKKAFEIFKASAVKIYVDGSNVAHNGKPKPDSKNIRLLVKELKFWKFKDITVLADASLRHTIKNPFELDEMKKEGILVEVPSKTSADEFLIAAIKKDKCLVVSNDEFRDWKHNDKWAKDKLDSIRIPFRILKGDHVILSGLEAFRENLIEQ